MFRNGILFCFRCFENEFCFLAMETIFSYENQVPKNLKFNYVLTFFVFKTYFYPFFPLFLMIFRIFHKPLSKFPKISASPIRTNHFRRFSGLRNIMVFWYFFNFWWMETEFCFVSFWFSVSHSDFWKLRFFCEFLLVYFSMIYFRFFNKVG